MGNHQPFDTIAEVSLRITPPASGKSFRPSCAKLDALAGMLGHASMTSIQTCAKVVDRMTENPVRCLEDGGLIFGLVAGIMVAQKTPCDVAASRAVARPTRPV
jgi:hypothetical protein